MSPRKAPQDHLKAEADPGPLRFTFDGVAYVVPRENADNMELFELIEDGKSLSAARAFVGADQWREFKDRVRLPDGRVPAAPVNGFLEALMDSIGGNR